MLNRFQFEKAAQQLNENEGTTLNVHTGRFPKRGWSVGFGAAMGALETIPHGQATGRHLEHTYQKHERSYRDAGHMGAWVDPAKREGEVEPARVYPETRKGFLTASGKVHQHGEKAMYSLSTGRLFWNVTHPGLAKTAQTATERFPAEEVKQNADVLASSGMTPQRIGRMYRRASKRL